MSENKSFAVSVPGWEAAKENVLPIKRGRSAKGLSDTLTKPLQQPLIESTNGMNGTMGKTPEEDFEEQLRISGGDPIAKLCCYIKYLKWTRDEYPSATDVALKLLERATFELKDVDALKNDTRFIKLWIEYADMVRTPGEIFTFMSSNKIGEKVSLFWIAWAFVAEKANNFKLTDQIFQKGTRRNAEPKDILSKRYHQFQRRMARQYLNNQRGGIADEEGDATAAAGTGNTATTSSNRDVAAVDAAVTAAAMFAIRNAGSVSTTTTTTMTTAAATSRGAGGGGVGDENQQVRPALQSMGGSDQSASGSLAHTLHQQRQQQQQQQIRQQSAGSHGANASGSSSRRNNASSSSSTTGRRRPGNHGSSSNSNNQGLTFEIFSGDGAATGTTSSTSSSSSGSSNSLLRGASATAPAVHSTYNNLGTEQQRRKENEGPVTQWTQGPLVPVPSATTTGSTSSGVSSSSRGASRGNSRHDVYPTIAPTASVVPPEFVIFEDAGSSSSSSAVTAAAVASVASGGEHAGLSVRQKLEPSQSARNPSGGSSSGVGASKTTTSGHVLNAIETISRQPLARHHMEQPSASAENPSVATSASTSTTTTLTKRKLPPVLSMKVDVADKTKEEEEEEEEEIGAVPCSEEEEGTVAGAVQQEVDAEEQQQQQHDVAVSDTMNTYTGTFSIFEDTTFLTGNNTGSSSRESLTVAETLATVEGLLEAAAKEEANNGHAATAEEEVDGEEEGTMSLSKLLCSSTTNTPSAIAIDTALAVSPPAPPADSDAIAAAEAAIAADAPTAGGVVDYCSSEEIQPTNIHQQGAEPHALQQQQQQQQEEEQEQKELEAMLADMGVLPEGGEEEDVTINTRLAMRDIDCMFCSPTVERRRQSMLASSSSTSTQQQQQQQGTTTTTAGRPANGSIVDENNLQEEASAVTAGPAAESAGFTIFDDSSSRMPPPSTTMTTTTSTATAKHLQTQSRSFKSTGLLPQSSSSTAPVAGDVSKLSSSHNPQQHQQQQRLQSRTVLSARVSDAFSAVKDISVIRESSQEYSTMAMHDDEDHIEVSLLNSHSKSILPTSVPTFPQSQMKPPRPQQNQQHQQRAGDSDGRGVSVSSSSNSSSCMGATGSNGSSAMGFEIFDDSSSASSVLMKVADNSSSSTRVDDLGCLGRNNCEIEGDNIPTNMITSTCRDTLVDMIVAYSRSYNSNSSTTTTTVRPHRQHAALPLIVLPASSFNSLTSDCLHLIIRYLLSMEHSNHPQAQDIALQQQLEGLQCSVHIEKANLPPAFKYRSKSAGTSAASTVHLPNSSRASSQWTQVGMLGRGSFGHAWLMRRCVDSTIICNIAGVDASVRKIREDHFRVFKVDSDDGESVIWEAFVHKQIQGRIASHLNRVELLAQYRRYFLPPSALYVYHHHHRSSGSAPQPTYMDGSDGSMTTSAAAATSTMGSAVLEMPYAPLGTLLNVLEVLTSGRSSAPTFRSAPDSAAAGVRSIGCGGGGGGGKRGSIKMSGSSRTAGVVSFSSQEHEYLAMYLALRMVEAVAVLHRVGFLHCDIKSDNWVLYETENQQQDDGHHRQQQHEDNSLCVHVALIDLGKARSSIATYSVHSVTPSGDKLADQVSLLKCLYNMQPTHHQNVEPCVDVLYTGQTGHHRYACPEASMRGHVPAPLRDDNSALADAAVGGDVGDADEDMSNTVVAGQQGWSYQLDFRGLITCIHELLFTSPLTCVREPHQRILRRGFDVEFTLHLLGSSCPCVSAWWKHRSNDLDSQSFWVPCATLKRYWDKRGWSVVYLLLLNASLFLPVNEPVTGSEYQSFFMAVTSLVVTTLKQHLEHLNSVKSSEKVFAKLLTALKR